ncbi:MAG TPA: tetraacyldisaccharide 4'-kinase [Longimicrobiales bacterium]
MERYGGAPGRGGGRLRAGVSRWWRGEAGGILWRGASVALAPAEAAYGAAVRLRNALYASGIRRAHRVGVPVLSVGNLAVGGTGKTPVARWLAALLEARGARVAVLHGGYAADEPELHRLWRPGSLVLAMRDRVAAARLAIAQGATVLVLDDGFQHRRLHRDLDLVLVSAESWTARPHLLPRGPWREPPGALARAGAIAVTRRAASQAAAQRVAAEVATFARGAIVARIHLHPAGWRSGGDVRAEGPKGGAVAVAGVAEPELFFANARQAGADIEATLVFPDHHAYTRQDLERIAAVAGGRAVVTTAKDAVKLRALEAELDLWILEQEVIVEEGLEALTAAMDRLLDRTFARKEGRAS